MTDQWTVVKLKGGLGNQLFQFGFGLSSAHATGSRLVLDTSWFASQDLRGEELTSAFTDVPVADLAPTRVLNRVRLRPSGDVPGGWMRRRGERSFRFEPHLLEDSNKSTYFDGYFQSWRYLDGVRKQLDEALTLARPSREFVAAATDSRLATSIGVHVRLGDYRTDSAANRVHGVLTPDYYGRALEQCMTDTGLTRIVLFSDEPDEAVLRIPALANAEVIEIPSDAHPMESVALLSQCGARVIANSSFSWWASYLADANPHATYAPWPWFRSEKHDARDLLPEAWTRVPAEWTTGEVG